MEGQLPGYASGTAFRMATERLQIELNSDKIREIESLMEEVRVSTKKEFVNAALTLLKWAIKERRAGRVIASIDEKSDSYKELEMPVLSEVRSVGQTTN
jgi:Arc/MetJ family transcription regulator